MKSHALLMMSSLIVAGCAYDDNQAPPPKPQDPAFTISVRVIEKSGRCHTLASGDDRFAVDRGVLRGIPAGAWVRVRAYSARRQSCPNAQRIVVTSLRRIRPPVATRSFTNPRYRGLGLDSCRRYRRQCGRPAARAFCRRNGFRRLVAFSTRPARRTRVYGSGRICRSRGRLVCRRFRVIRCRR